MNAEITSYGISYLVCITAFGATLVGLLFTAVARRLRARRQRSANRGEVRPLAA
jgi:hypothetical protein